MSVVRVILLRKKVRIKEADVQKTNLNTTSKLVNNKRVCLCAWVIFLSLWKYTEVVLDQPSKKIKKQDKTVAPCSAL